MSFSYRLFENILCIWILFLLLFIEGMETDHYPFILPAKGSKFYCNTAAGGLLLM